MDEAPPFSGGGETPEALRARVAQKVQNASIALLIVGILGVLSSLFGIVSSFAMPFLQLEKLDLDDLGDLGDLLLSPWFNAAFSCLGLGLSAVVVYGANGMKRFQGYAWALTAAIIALFPCTSPCCCLVATPIGIWALIVLLDDDVKRAFV